MSFSCAWLAGCLAGLPICELLINLATFWLGATRNLLETFFGDVGHFKKAASTICELLIKLASCQLPMYECFLLGPPASSQVMSVPIYVMVCPLLCVRVFCKLEKHDTHVCMYVCVYVQKRAMYVHVSVCMYACT